MSARKIIAIGGSDAGISAALRARELDPTSEVTVVVADAYPNFSICGIPYYVSGEVTHWSNLAHRTAADLAATGMTVHTDTLATAIDAAGHRLTVTGPDGATRDLDYDALVIGTGAVSVRPPITGLDQLGPDDGVHLLHSMGDTFAVMNTLTTKDPKTAIIIGAGYIGLEMAEGLTARGIHVTQIEALPEVLPTVEPELGALVHAELTRNGVDVRTGTLVTAVNRTATGGLAVTTSRGEETDQVTADRLTLPNTCGLGFRNRSFKPDWREACDLCKCLTFHHRHAWAHAEHGYSAARRRGDSERVLDAARAFDGRDHRVCHSEQSHALPHGIAERLISGIEYGEVLALRAAPVRDQNIDDRGAASDDIVLRKAIGPLNIAPRSRLNDGNIAAVVGQHTCYGDFRLEDSEFGCRCANAEVLDQPRVNLDSGFRSFSGAFGHQHHIHEGGFAGFVKALARHHRIVPIEHVLALCLSGTRHPTLAVTDYERKRISRTEADKRDGCDDCVGPFRETRAVDRIAHGCCSP